MYMNPTKFLTYEELIKSFWRLQYSFYSRILFLRLLCCCIFSDEMQTGIDDENLSDAEQNKIRSDDESKTPIMSSKAVRELYSITPGIDSADSSDNESGETENTRLLKDEAPCSSAKPTAKEKPSNSSSHCDEGRPLLSRQGEVDQCSDSSIEMNIETTQRIKQDSKPSNSVSSVSEGVMASVGTVTKDDEEEDTESQRVVPIILTLSPTKNGNNQISSIVATRDLSSAMTRPSGMPAAPRSPKQKNAKGSRSRFVHYSAVVGRRKQTATRSWGKTKTKKILRLLIPGRWKSLQAKAVFLRIRVNRNATTKMAAVWMVVDRIAKENLVLQTTIL